MNSPDAPHGIPENLFPSKPSPDGLRFRKFLRDPALIPFFVGRIQAAMLLPALARQQQEGVFRSVFADWQKIGADGQPADCAAFGQLVEVVALLIAGKTAEARAKADYDSQFPEQAEYAAWMELLAQESGLRETGPHLVRVPVVFVHPGVPDASFEQVARLELRLVSGPPRVCVHPADRFRRLVKQRVPAADGKVAIVEQAGPAEPDFIRAIEDACESARSYWLEIGESPRLGTVVWRLLDFTSDQPYQWQKSVQGPSAGGAALYGALHLLHPGVKVPDKYVFVLSQLRNANGVRTPQLQPVLGLKMKMAGAFIAVAKHNPAFAHGACFAIPGALTEADLPADVGQHQVWQGVSTPAGLLSLSSFCSPARPVSAPEKTIIIHMPQPTTPAMKTPVSDLKTALANLNSRYNSRIISAMTEAAQLAARHNRNAHKEAVEECMRMLLDGRFRLMVAGRYRNGKSTFVNALLGLPEEKSQAARMGDASVQGPMPMGEVPTTIAMSTVTYAEQPFVRMIRFDRSTEAWTFQRYLKEAVARANPAENERFFKDIAEFTVGYSAPLLANYVDLIDAPGIDDNPQRTALAAEAVASSDAVIFVYSSRAFGGESEFAFAAEHIEGKRKGQFIVVNMFHKPKDPERFKAFLWHTLIHRKKADAPPYDGQNLEHHGLYCINAEEAYQGRVMGNRDLVESSGLLRFESKLGEYLRREKTRVRVESYAGKAKAAIDQLRDDLKRDSDLVFADASKVEMALKGLAPEYENLNRLGRNVETILELYRERLVVAAQTSFEALNASIRADLPGVIGAHEFRTASGFFGSLAAGVLANKIAQEARTVATQFIEDRVKMWNAEGGGLALAVQPLLQQMNEELTREARDMDATVERINVCLDGLVDQTVSAREVTGISKRDRTLSSIAGYMTGVGILAGATTGWRGVAWSLGGSLASATVLAVLGILTGPIGWAAVALVGLFTGMTMGGSGVKEKIRKSTIEAFDAALAETPAKASPALRKAVIGGKNSGGELYGFEHYREPVLNAVKKTISHQYEQLQSTKQSATADLGEKQAKVAALTVSMKRLGELNAELDAVCVDLLQTNAEAA